MIRLFSASIATLALLLAGTGGASAQMFFDFTGTSNNSFLGRSSPISRSTVVYPTRYAPGTIVINTGERRLYLVLRNGQALRYGIGVGRDGFRWGGVHRISAKKEWPGWTPPSQMLARRPDLPRHMRGGIENPLGARALYLGSTLYRIHGSNEPETIGHPHPWSRALVSTDNCTFWYCPFHEHAASPARYAGPGIAADT